MPENDQERRIARLQKEFERLSAQHSEHMARIPPTASPALRQSHAKRAEILERRIRMLKAELHDSTSCHRGKLPITRNRVVPG